MARTTKPLRDSECAALKPADKPYRRYDGNGLALQVNPSGSKIWRFRYKRPYDGKADQLTLGEYPYLSLARARQRRDEAKALLSEGTDPKRHARRKKEEEQQAAYTFADATQEWLAREYPGWKPSHGDRVKSAIERDVISVIGKERLTDINAEKILACIRKVEERQAYETARRLLQKINSILISAVLTGRIPTNPAAELHRLLQKTKKSQQPQNHVPLNELGTLVLKIHNYRRAPMTRCGLLFALFTATRTQEFRFAEWSEIDHAEQLWRIPESRMKVAHMGDHLVPLSSHAMHVLEELWPISGSSGVLFPGFQGNQFASENTFLHALYRIGYKDRQTVHGFRHLFSSSSYQAGWRGEAIERQLAHSDHNKVRETYARQADLLSERRELMQWWGNHLMSFVE